MKVYLYELFRDVCAKDERGRDFPTGKGYWETMLVFGTEEVARKYNRTLPEYYHGREDSGWRIRQMSVHEPPIKYSRT